MNTRYLYHTCRIFIGLILITLTVLSCQRLPQPDFTYAPMENPEAGDTIRFNNASVDATSYQWEFGDGSSSIQENPNYIYSRAGIYDVKLTAFNEAGEEAVTETLTINQPTVLGFLVYDSTGENVLSGAEVLIFDNEYDWEFNMDEPLRNGVTDNNGVVLFENVEPIVYYILVVKLESNGAWIFPGYTPQLTQNDVNLFNVPCLWVENDTKSTSTAEFLMKESGIHRALRLVGPRK